MKKWAYYNDTDPYICEWVRNLIKAGLVMDGEVDGRSIAEVQPEDVRGFHECHFFCGILGWPLALRMAGYTVPNTWTGSCPCQPFSPAGKQAGTADERHLWPEFFRLIAECRPATVFGEQVASAKVLGLSGAGSRVPKAIQEAEPRSRFGSPRTVQGIKERAGVRLTGSSSGHPVEDRCRCLRTFGDGVQPGRRPDMGQPLDRPDRHDEGVHAWQHSDCPSCGKQRDGGLGRGQDAGDCAFDPQEANRRLQRAFGTAREELEESVGDIWIARVSIDLEAAGYRVRSCDLPAASVGAPHIRQRLWWVADADGGQSGQAGAGRLQPGGEHGQQSENGGAGGGLADTSSERRQQERRGSPGDESPNGRRQDGDHEPASDGKGCGLGDSGSARLPERGSDRRVQRETVGPQQGQAAVGAGCWTDAAWLPCADGKARRIVARPVWLVNGLSGRLDYLSPNEEVTYAETTAERPGEVLRGVRRVDGEETVRARVGGPRGIREAEILRPTVHGLGNDGRHKESDTEKQPEAVSEEGRAALLGLWHHIQSSCTPSQPRPDGQPRVKFADAMRALSSAATLADIEGDSGTAAALRALQEACEAQRPVQYTLHALSEAWRSAVEARAATGEGVGFGSGLWAVQPVAPLVRKFDTRVGALRGFGNAIVPQVAAEFVRAFIGRDAAA